MTDFDVTIHNCNSIDRADIRITKNSLNIKYGPNGVGKSTIAKAIAIQARGDGTLDSLIPFKNQGKAEAEKSKVDGINGIKSVLVFDEEYVNQFAFQQDEVVRNSFESTAVRQFRRGGGLDYCKRSGKRTFGVSPIPK